EDHLSWIARAAPGRGGARAKANASQERSRARLRSMRRRALVRCDIDRPSLGHATGRRFGSPAGGLPASGGRRLAIIPERRAGGSTPWAREVTSLRGLRATPAQAKQ